jgi:DNA polymerase I
MKIAKFDLETDGFLEAVTRVHVMVVTCQSTGKVSVFRNEQMSEGLSYLDSFDLLVGHNIIKYDMPVLGKLYGYKRHWSHLRDTMVLSRLMFADIFEADLERVKKGTFPSHLVGKHSLEAWGYRLGNYKGSYNGDPSIEDEELRAEQKWKQWNQAMEDYCIQDVGVTNSLWKMLLDLKWSEESILLETQVASILARQEAKGFLFDTQKAAALYGKLVTRKAELERVLQDVFKPKQVKAGEPFIPKRDNKTLGYTAGVPIQKWKTITFNPGSRDHIALWLKEQYGWEPVEFTKDGKAQVDEQVISKLPYPEAAPLKEYLMVSKRIGQLAEGKEAWLKHVKADGRIHGGVNTMGAVTGRMTHMSPNLAQVPASYSPYGHECRELFCVPKGYTLIGCDASALELCDLAGYMGFYDNGAYIDVVLKGDKKLGTDIHSTNARALGLDPKGTYFDGESGRDIAKTWFYAFIYGAGDEKLGFILTRKKGAISVKRGKQARNDFLTNLPAMGKLVKVVKDRAQKQKWLKGLDGRRISVRSGHAALNTLLQCAGAVQMKRALCILDDNLQAAGLIPGPHYEFVANVHDEWQIEVKDEYVQTVGPMAQESIRLSGESFQFRCPLAGEWKAGRTWADTH